MSQSSQISESPTAKLNPGLESTINKLKIITVRRHDKDARGGLISPDDSSKMELYGRRFKSNYDPRGSPRRQEDSAKAIAQFLKLVQEIPGATLQELSSHFDTQQQISVQVSPIATEATLNQSPD